VKKPPLTNSMKKNDNKTLIVVLGPTAVGKTALSIALAKKYKTEIISADSRQFFKELSIGTAKPSPVELAEVPHHFIGTHSIHENLNIGWYEDAAMACITTLFKTKDMLILTGGSGLYINAVCEGLDALPEGNETLRAELNETLKTKGLSALGAQLKTLDPLYFSQVDPSNPHRIIRALEVCLLTGKPYSSFRIKTKKERPFSILKIGLSLPRENLYQRINTRVDVMLESGLIAEAKSMLADRHCNALQTVGYTELFDFFDGKYTLEEAVTKIKQHTRHYAKRQMTWFKKDETISWFHPEEMDLIIKKITSLFQSQEHHPPVPAHRATHQ
jgi:tRNA dimethylallyltransferase